MSNNLYISYDLNSPHQDYNAVIEVIKSLGSWASVQKSLWYVKSEHSAEEAAKIVIGKMAANDSLIVIDTKGNDAYWYNISEEVTKHMQKYWHK